MIRTICMLFAAMAVSSNSAEPLTTRADGYYIDMNVRCESDDKAACAALVRSFQALNDKVRQAQ